MPAETPAPKAEQPANAEEPAKWRALAAEARACAAAMAEPRARRLMQDIAAAYEKLAQRADSQSPRASN
ncbi:MAG TPA: hypothetical protein VFR00_15230 [Hyphomicrobiaceae bacterium]|nr:hypothetical protein [Hyphomicrobiaceae bacterium]